MGDGLQEVIVLVQLVSVGLIHLLFTLILLNKTDVFCTFIWSNRKKDAKTQSGDSTAPHYPVVVFVVVLLCTNVLPAAFI